MKKNIEIYIKTITQVQPTEDPEKVVKAIKNIFPDVELKIDGNNITFFSKDKKTLDKIRKFARDEQVLDYARMYAIRNMFSNMIMLRLNKQAALAGKICFADTDDESPLGTIHVMIESENIEKVLDWLFPATEFGEVKEEEEI